MYDLNGKSSPAGFAKRLKQARYEAGLTQDGLASQLGVSARAVQTWEQGSRMPRAYTLDSIATATGRPLSWFFEREVAA